MPDIPLDVASFITEHLDSLLDLQVLIALSDDPDRWWDAGAMASAVLAPIPETRDTLEKFAGRNLLDLRATDDLRYRLRPGHDELARTLTLFLTFYRQSPLVVIRRIGATTSRGISDFSDAFRFRRK